MSTNPRNVSANAILNVGLAEGAYGEISVHIDLDEIKKELDVILNSMPIYSDYKNIYNMFFNNKNMLLHQLIEIAFDNLIGKNNDLTKNYYNAINSIMDISKSYDDNDIQKYVVLKIIDIIRANTKTMCTELSTHVHDITNIKTLDALLSYIQYYYNSFQTILATQKQNNNAEAYYKNAITQDINSIKSIKSINSINSSNRINTIHNNIAQYIKKLYLQKFMFCCIILYAINRYEKLQLEIQQYLLPNTNKEFNTYGEEVVPNQPNPIHT